MSRRTPVIVHVGILGDKPGGIAQVVNQYLSWGLSGFQAIGVLSTRGKRDWAAPALWLLAAFKLLLVRTKHGRSPVLVHMSAKGSFVREGSLVVWSRLIGHRVGIHLHGSQFPDFSDQHPRLVRFVAAAAAVVFVLTDESLLILKRLLSGRPTRLVRLSNAVDVPAGTDSKERLVLFGGEVGARKGADVLLAAWERVGEERSDWTLILAGPVHPAFDRLGLGYPGVVSLGAIPHEEVLALQSRAAIAVLPSRNEAMPMFLLESMARGCAVVATPVGQVEELVGASGELVTVGDVEGLALALRRLTGDPSLLARSGVASRRRVEDSYSSERVRGLLEAEWGSLARKDIDND